MRLSFVNAHHDRAADHLIGKLGFGILRRCFTDDGSASNDGDFIRNCSDLAQFVGNEDDRCSRIGKLTHDRHEFIGFLGSQNRRWFIKNKDFCLTREGLHDFDSLLGTNRKVFDEGIGIEIETKACRDFFNSASGLRKINQSACFCRFKTQSDRFCDGKDRDQHEVLVDHSNPRGNRITGAVEVDRLAIDEDFSFIGLVKAVKHIHQR